MKSTDINSKLIKSYLDLMKNLSPASKLDLIEKLTKSLKMDLGKSRKSFSAPSAHWIPKNLLRN